MRLEACYFASPQARTPWVRLGRVLDYTAEQHCPTWTRVVDRIQPLAVRGFYSTFIQNTQKLDHWVTRAINADDGEELLLLDADTIILRSLDAIWQRPFDVCYTDKPVGHPLSFGGFNGGVLFLRISARVRAAMTAWRDINAQLLRDPKPAWRKSFGGINQASFAGMLASAAGAALHVTTVPCVEWNCEDTGWEVFDPAVTRILHVKGRLREQLFYAATGAADPALARLVELWRAHDRAARQAATV